MGFGDFFTLTEMKDGLTASDRVRELMNAMLEEKDCVLKSVEVAAKQWSTVASTIAATKDKDILHLFVQLDGISFINKWLENAQNLGNGPSDSSVEEAIVTLLHAVEKLCISYEQSVALGIRVTVEKLLGHSNVTVKEKATALFGSWKQQNAGEVVTSLGEGEDIETTITGVGHENTLGKTDKEGDVLLGDDVVVETQTDKDDSFLEQEKMEVEGAIVEKPLAESLCGEGKHSPCRLDGNPSSSSSTAAVPDKDEIVPNQLCANEEQKQELASPTERLEAMDISASPSEKTPTESDLQADTVLKVDCASKESTIDDMKADMSSSSKENLEINVGETVGVSQNQDREDDTKTLDNSGNEDASPKPASPDTSSSRRYSESTDGEHSSSESKGLGNDADFSKAETKDNHMAKKNMSDFELNYGMVDALEVARQVAIEVEREVEGQTESSCSSSPKKMEKTETRQPNSPESVHPNETQTNERASKEGGLSNDPNVDPSRVPGSEHGSENKQDKGIIDFDLNQDIILDDTEQVLDTSTHVSIVSASRAAAAPGFPGPPLQFKGAHGWKGSAATSAFRPASPRKVHRSLLDFDLNMSEDIDEKAPDYSLPRKQILLSGESSGECRPNLDLNLISNEGDAPPSDWRMSERFLLGRNGYQNASPSTSSSSMQQPSRNFDLNDQPSFLNDSTELSFLAKLTSSRNLNSPIGPRSNNNVISIMGTKVEVNRKNNISPQPNGRLLEPSLDVNLSRTPVSGIPSSVLYPHPNMYGLTTGPTGGFSQVMYGPNGPIPYMLDSRGTQLGAFPYSQPPFASSIYGNPPGFSGPGPSRPNYELNLGMMGERLNRESGSLRQFLGPGPNRSPDESMFTFQPSSSGKRKEPDGGFWEPHSLDYKHHNQPWN